MSIPKHHHFVSRCQMNEFFNHAEQRIFVLNKKTGHIESRKSTKRILREEFGNSFESEKEPDNTTLELQLKALFEDKYPVHLENIRELLETAKVTDDVYYSLYCLATIGICGEMRHPHYKREIDSITYNFNSDILHKLYGIPKSITKEFLRSKQKTPNRNLVDYISVAINSISKLDPLEFSIYLIQSDENFILPDTSGFIVRGQLEKYQNRNIREIIQVGVPISSKIFILASPKILELNENKLVKINGKNSEYVESINKNLFDFAKEEVVCVERATLEKFKK